MKSHSLSIMFLIFSFTIACSSGTVTPTSIQASPIAISATPTPLPMPSATLEPDSSKGCINLTEVPLNTDALNGLLVVYDYDFPNFNSYLLDPKSNQLLDIEKQTQLSWNSPATSVSTAYVSPDRKFLQAYLWDKNYAIVRTVDKIFNTYDIQGQEDWNRSRWLDNEHMFFQHFIAPYGSYSIVIYDPFTGEQKNMRIDLPNPYIVEDIGGRLSWVKADIDPSLKHVLYDDKDERLVLWDPDNEKEITSLPSPTDLQEGTWSPDGKQFAIRSPSSDSAPTELYLIDMDGVIRMTSFNQKYPFANVDILPEWSPDGRYIAFELKTSNVANPNPDDFQQLLTIMDTTTLDTQVYCLSGGAIWSPDSTQVIINTYVSSEEVKPILVDLTHKTQSTLDTHGLSVIGWMAP